MKKTKIQNKNNQPVVNAWITRKEAIKMLQCGKVKYQELVKYKQINAQTFINRAYVELSSIERYLANNPKYNTNRKKYLKKEETDG